MLDEDPIEGIPDRVVIVEVDAAGETAFGTLRDQGSISARRFATVNSRMTDAVKLPWFAREPVRGFQAVPICAWNRSGT